MRRRARLALAIALTGSVGFTGSSAVAAIYEVHACRLPNGAPAPAHGWAPQYAGTIVSIGCPGGKLTVRTPPGTHSPGWRGGIGFTAPADTRIVGLDEHVEVRIVQVPGAPPPWSWTYSERGVPVGDDTAVAMRESDNLSRDEVLAYSTWKPLSRLELTLQCSYAQYSGPCQDNGSSFSVPRISVRLDDSTPPRILSSSGSLLQTTGPQRGMRHLALGLRDAGAGLYRVRVEVDGEQMTELPIDDNQGVCRRPFVAPVPCKLAAAIDVPVDTTRLIDGRHTIHVRAFDATGVNAATVGPISLVVDNQPDPPPRGTSACPPTNAASIRRRLKTKVVRFGDQRSLSGACRDLGTLLGAPGWASSTTHLSAGGRAWRGLESEAASRSASARSRPRASDPYSCPRRVRRKPAENQSTSR